jgi:hypothetical protein
LWRFKIQSKKYIDFKMLNSSTFEAFYWSLTWFLCDNGFVFIFQIFVIKSIAIECSYLATWKQNKCSLWRRNCQCFSLNQHLNVVLGLNYSTICGFDFEGHLLMISCITTSATLCFCKIKKKSVKNITTEFVLLGKLFFMKYFVTVILNNIKKFWNKYLKC